MPITQSLSSKANISKRTNNDLPFSPAQPVISRYSGTSTAGQTVINLSFSVDTTFTDNFFLFVNGLKLTIGSGNDFTFTSIAADLTSSQVTLNQTIPGNLNIEAYKMGLKKEVEFQTDNRFVTAYDYLDQAFQGFVATNQLRTATTTTGTPAAGTFYSSITNRAAIVDPSQDLKPRMGIDRISTQAITLLQNEFGPNGESVYVVVNDTSGAIRFIGNWSPQVGSSGQYILSSVTGDSVEISFYGTGLNLLDAASSAAASADINIKVDGVAAGSISNPSTNSIILNGRNYSPNRVRNVVSGLSLGIHTVSLTVGSNTSIFNLIFMGFEILNESSLVKVTPGNAYAKGQKYASASLQSFAYNAPVTGTRGGRVVVYQRPDGTLGQSWQAVNAAQANLTAADHTNEEPVRTYYPREFGAGRSDDFSTLTTTPSNRAFTLDDGTTTLVVQNGVLSGTGPEGLAAGNSGDYISFTFVGTGLDVFVGNFAATATSTITVDGIAISTATLNFATANVDFKIVSGLPYGTHNVKITNTTSAGSPRIAKFTVYQPKKPAIPSGSVELADYNVLANFVANSTASLDTISTGALRKSNSREWTYVGTGFAIGVNVGNSVGGFSMDSSSTSDSASYTFFGTGFDFRFLALTDTGNTIVTVDGLIPNTTNFAGSTTAVYGGTVSYNPANGVLAESAASTVPGCGFIVTGLPLGLHTVKFAHNSGTTMRVNTLDIITPIHSVKSNSPADLQSTLTVGSCSISDNRALSPVRGIEKPRKPWYQTYAIQQVTTTVTAVVPMADTDMVVNVDAAGSLDIEYSVTLTSFSTGISTYVQVYIDGSAVGVEKAYSVVANGVFSVLNDSFTVPIGPGQHKINLQWRIDAAGTGRSPNRNLKVRVF